MAAHGASLTASLDARPALRTADQLVDVLASCGVEVIFGLPGGPIPPLHDALIDRRGIRVVTTRHESGALFAAAGYAMASGKLGVALVTSGPGVLNAMTGLASAFCDGVPVLLLVGEVPRRNFGRGALQDGSANHLNVIGMASHITKLAAEVVTPAQAPAMLRRAIATATMGRPGPVVLTLPMDTTLEPTPAADLWVEPSITYRIPTQVAAAAARALSESPRTVVLAGSGVRHGDGPRRLLQLAERLQVPVMTTPKAKGVFPEDHPLALGIFGLGGHPSASEHLKGRIDTLLAIGTSLGETATNGWSPLLIPRRTFVQVDLEARHIGRSYTPTMGIVAPAEQFLRRMTELVPQAPPRRFGVRHHLDPSLLGDGPEGRIAPPRALWELQQVMPADTIYCADMGEHLVFALHYLRLARPDAFLTMTGLGSMGSSIGGAIGSQLAHRGRRVAAVIGDGCLAMYASEIATAVTERLPLVFFVMNDQRLGMVELGNQTVYGRTPAYPVGSMDVRRLAESLGARSLVCEHAGEVLGSGPMLRQARGPVVVDVRIDRRVSMPKLEYAAARAHRAGRPQIVN